LIALKQKLLSQPENIRHKVNLTYITARGPWYNKTWKGRIEQSGGIITNIGIHLFDLMLWLFGDFISSETRYSNSNRASGKILLQHAEITWKLSTALEDLPANKECKSAYREIEIDGEILEFSNGFTDLHTLTYQEILVGRGFGIKQARPAIELVEQLRKIQ